MSNLTFQKVISDSIDARLSDVHVAMPGRIESYDAATQTADIQPLIKNVMKDPDGNEYSESMPVLPSVPIAFPRAGDWFLSFPLAKGDTVLVVFCERNIDQWMSKGDLVDPGDIAMHTLNGAVAIPGVYAQPDKLTDAHTSNMVLGKSGGTQIHIKDDGVFIGSETAAESMVLGDTLKGHLDAIYAREAAMDAWVPAPPDGGAALKAILTANPAVVVPAILSTKHKVDA